MEGARKAPGSGARIAGSIKEGLSSTWTLLSETTLYLSRAGLLASYEIQLRELRRKLSLRQGERDADRRAREEIVLLRKNLRADGHDLALGSFSITFEGFRSDDCVAQGFERLVILIAGADLLYVTGQDNHRTLAEFLDKRFAGLGIDASREFHFLWFRRQATVIRVSGSDTETKEDFARLEALYAAKPLVLLQGLKRLK
jgi:hypothetical protein